VGVLAVDGVAFAGIVWDGLLFGEGVIAYGWVFFGVSSGNRTYIHNLDYARKDRLHIYR
jgi:hypothetical protein